jgi:hypothetical protein
VRAKWAAMLTFENPINSLSAIGLALGALCGMAGTFVARPHIQALLWAIDGAAALVMAAALLTLKHFRRGREVVAAAGRRNRVLGSAEDGGAGGRSSRSDPLARFYAPTELSSTTARRILVDCAVPPCGPPISYLARPSPACATRR